MANRLRLGEEEAAFWCLHADLQRHYSGQFVAIHGGRLVDHDTDQVALFRRVKTRFPGEFVWIAPVGPSPDETYVICSPQLAAY